MEVTRATETSDIRRVLAFARASGAPPEALSWLIRMSLRADSRRGASARDVSPVAKAVAGHA